MKIEAVGAKNFRTLEKFELTLSQNYCAISGRNNSGKTTVIKLIRHFFDKRDDDGFDRDRNRITFARDFTQWSKEDALEVWVAATIDRTDDSEVFFVVETYAPQKNEPLGQVAKIQLHERMEKDGNSTFKCEVNGEQVEGQGGVEILKKLKSVSNLFVYNSAQPTRRLFYLGSSFTEVLTTHALSARSSNTKKALIAFSESWQRSTMLS